MVISVIFSLSLILHGDILQYFVCWITLSCAFLCKKAAYAAVQRIISECAAASTSPSLKIFHEKEFDSSSFQGISANSFLCTPQPVGDFPIMNQHYSADGEPLCDTSSYLLYSWLTYKLNTNWNRITRPPILPNCPSSQFTHRLGLKFYLTPHSLQVIEITMCISHVLYSLCLH